MKLPWVVGVTGASGAVYARRLLQTLLQADVEVHLSISPAAAEVFLQELDLKLDLTAFRPEQLLGDENKQATKLHYHPYLDLLAPIASGSFRTAGMIICPCSGGTLSAIAHGADQNLIQRSASVHLKERRKLILVPRETPLSLPMIENLRAATLAGAVILPAMPGWYHQPTSLDDLVDFVVARILDQADIPHQLSRRWREKD
jgi:4-hydroxy-3-polyprenylbenzoate decarboxylase